MTYEEIRQLFTSLNITCKNGIWKIGANRNDTSVIIAMLTPHLQGISAQEAMDMYTNPPREANSIPMLTGIRKHAQIHSSKFDYQSWNKVDDYLFSRIYYSLNPIDKSLILLIKSTEDEYKPVFIGGNRTTQITTLASVCNSVYIDENTTYNDWLVSKVNAMNAKMNEHCMNIFNDTSITANDKIPRIIDYLTERYSASMLHRKYTANVLYKVIEVGEESIMTPVSMRVIDDNQVTVNVYSHILDSLDILAQKMDKLMDMPQAYSSVKGVKCFKYLDLTNIMKSGSTPTWDFYLKRFNADEAEVLKAYIYAIFNSKNKSRQMLYIHDNGFTGKTAMSNAIATYLGSDIVGALQKDSLNNSFGLAKVWDKRLVTIDDNKNTKIVRSEKMHMMLGGGRGEIEMKGKNSFSAQFNLKMIVSGNVLPEIDTSATHEITRIIIIKPKVNNEILQQIAAKKADGSIRYDSFGKPVLVGDDGFSDKLVSEFPKFLTQCEKSYYNLCPNDANIVLPDSMIDELYDLTSDECVQMDSFIDNIFEFDDNVFIEKSEMYNIYNRMAERFNLDKSSNAYANFTTHLMKSHNVVSTRGARPNRVNIFKGVKLKGSDISIDKQEPVEPQSIRTMMRML